MTLDARSGIFETSSMQINGHKPKNIE